MGSWWVYIAPRAWLSLIEFVYPLIHTIPFYMQCLIRSPISWVLLTAFDISIIFHLTEDRIELWSCQVCLSHASRLDSAGQHGRLIIHIIALEPSTTSFKLLFCKWQCKISKNTNTKNIALIYVWYKEIYKTLFRLFDETLAGAILYLQDTQLYVPYANFSRFHAFLSANFSKTSYMCWAQNLKEESQNYLIYLNI